MKIVATIEARMASYRLPGKVLKEALGKPILHHLVTRLRAVPSILYVCEPIRKHAQLQHGDETYWGYTEETALRYFLSNLHSLRLVLEKIIIRPHPPESANKYH